MTWGVAKPVILLSLILLFPVAAFAQEASTHRNDH